MKYIHVFRLKQGVTQSSKMDSVLPRDKSLQIQFKVGSSRSARRDNSNNANNMNIQVRMKNLRPVKVSGKIGQKRSKSQSQTSRQSN